MAEYNNPLSGFLGGFSAPLIAREKEDRLLKNQLGLIGLQNDLATQTATATREFETINQTITSYSSRRDKLTEERNKMIRSAYAPAGSNNMMALTPAQSNARIREMGFEPGYFKQIVQQMDDQIGKLGVGIDQLMVYKTNKYGPSGVSFKHISSIGGFPRTRGAGLTGAEVNPLAGAGAPPQGDPNFWSNMAKIGVDAGSAIGTTASNAAQAIAEANKKAGEEIRVDPNQKGGPYERWGWTLPGSGLIVEGGVQVIPPLVHKAVVSLGVGIGSKDNTVNKYYEAFSRMLGIDPTQTADFWAGGGSSLGKIKAAGKEIPKDFSRLIDWVDGLLIQHGFVPPGYEKGPNGQIVLIPGSVRDLMKKEAAGVSADAEAGVASVTPGSMEDLPRIDAGDPPPTTAISTGLGEQSTAEAVPIPSRSSTSTFELIKTPHGEPRSLEEAVDPSSVPLYDPSGMDANENIPGSPTGRLLGPRDSVGGIIDRQLIDAFKDSGALPNLSIDPNALVNPYEDGSFTLEGDYLEPDVLQPSEPLPYRPPSAETSSVDTPVAVSSEDAAVTTAPLSEVMNVDSFEAMDTAADTAAAYTDSSDYLAVVEEFYASQGGNWANVGAGVVGTAAIVLGKKMRDAGDDFLRDKGATITKGASARALKKSKAVVKKLNSQLKASKRMLKKMENNPDKFGDPLKQQAKVEKLEKDIFKQKQKFNALFRDKVLRASGRAGMIIGAFTLALTAGLETALGAEVAEDLTYQMMNGNQRAIELGMGIAEIIETIAIPATMLFDNPPRRSSLERMSGPEMEIAPDISGGRARNYETRFNRNAYDASLADAMVAGRQSMPVYEEARTPRTSIRRRSDPFIDVGQGDYYGRDADRESFGMQDWYDQQAREQKRTQGPKTSISRRSDAARVDESESTLDDLINWITSLGSSVVPEAAASDVPIESIGLAREVPEMVLNNPRIGFGPKISFTESKGLYDAVGYNTVTDEARPPDPMVNTSKWADVRAKYGDTLGIGKYQFTNDFLVDIYADTLKNSKKDAQIYLDNLVFKDSVQEQALALAFGYLGLEDVIRGKMSAKAFVDKIEGRWHGISKAIEEDPNYKQVMIDDLEGMVEQATGRTFTLSNRE